MIRVLVSLFALLSTNALSTIYKCADGYGQITYSETQCEKNHHQTILNLAVNPKATWRARLESMVFEGIEILTIKSVDKETLIEYNYNSISQSSEFLRACRQLSGLSVQLVNIKHNKGGKEGSATIKITNKPIIKLKPGLGKTVK